MSSWKRLARKIAAMEEKDIAVVKMIEEKDKEKGKREGSGRKISFRFQRMRNTDLRK